jgi:HlyD family secretion protein
LLAPGCQRRAEAYYQGYLEAELLELAAPVGGRLEVLGARRGDAVTNGQPLFALDPDPERLAVEEARQRVQQVRYRLDDQRTGLRPTEIAALEARLAQARAAANLAHLEWGRAGTLFDQGAISATERDQSRQAHDASSAQVAQLEAELLTARLGGRADQLRSLEQELAAAEAVLARAEWTLSQKRTASPVAGWVHDTYFEPGELVRPNVPILSLLPQGVVRVRFYVPEAEVERLVRGAVVRVRLARGEPEWGARVDYVSTQPEFTPPVIFSRQTRVKLVYMIEAHPEELPAVFLHPGQPVEVRL